MTSKIMWTFVVKPKQGGVVRTYLLQFTGHNFRGVHKFQSLIHFRRHFTLTGNIHCLRMRAYEWANDCDLSLFFLPIRSPTRHPLTFSHPSQVCLTCPMATMNTKWKIPPFLTRFSLNFATFRLPSFWTCKNLICILFGRNEPKYWHYLQFLFY